MKTAALAVATLALLGGASFAKDAQSYVTFPNAIRCQACGAEYHVRAEVTKENTLELKARLINKTSNPKTR
jgi:hypothetical protein